MSNLIFWLSASLKGKKWVKSFTFFPEGSMFWPHFIPVSLILAVMFYPGPKCWLTVWFWPLKSENSHFKPCDIQLHQPVRGFLQMAAYVYKRQEKCCHSATFLSATSVKVHGDRDGNKKNGKEIMSSVFIWLQRSRSVISDLQLLLLIIPITTGRNK